MTNDYISRQAAIDTVVFECGEWTGLAKEISKQLRQLPSAQPEITHCRDCKRSSRNRKYGCGLLSRDDDEIVPMFANDFCSYAVRREE